MADEENDDRDIERTPLFSRALLGRVAAVGLFVALGTFAVIQSVSKGRQATDDDHAGHDHAHISTELESDVDVDVKAGVQDKTAADGAKNPVGLAGFLKSGSPVTASSSSEASVSSRRSGITNPASNKPATTAKPVAGGFQAGSFNPGSKPPTSPASKPNTGGFSLGSRPKPSVTTQAPATSLANRFKPEVKPASPFAQSKPTAKPSTKPKTAADSTGTGFNLASRPKSNPALDPTFQKPKPPATPPGSSLRMTPSSLVKAKPTPQPKPETTRPPERLAQVNNGGFMPTIGKQGFGQSSSTAAQPSSTPPSNSPFSRPKSLAAATDGAVDSTRRTFGDLRKSVSTEANSLISKTKAAAEQGANATSRFAADTKAAINNRFEASASSSSGFNTALPKKDAPIRPGSSGGSNLRSFAANNSPTRPNSPTQPNPPRRPAPGIDQGRGLGRPQVTERSPSAASASLTASRPTNNRSSSVGSMQLASSVQRRSSSSPGDRRFDGVQAPSLTIEKVSPREIQVDQPADFEIRVRNVGRVTADDVLVIDRVPEGTDFLGAAPEPSSQVRGGTIEWNVGSIEPGQEKRIRMQLRPTKPGEIGSVAQVVFATQASMRTVVTKPVLAIEHATSPKVLMGDNFVFDVTVENRGDGPATDVIIQEEVPEQLEYQAGFRQLEYEVGTLMPGQKRQLRLALRAGKVGKFRNIMFASGKGGLEAKHELDLEVVAPEIAVKASGPTRRYLQREATHQFTIENRGTAKATSVDLVARLPAGLRYVRSDNRGRYDSQSHAVYWKMPELTEGVAGTVELTTMPFNVGQQDIKFEANADLNLTASTNQSLVVEHLVDVYFEIDDVVDPIEVGSNTRYRLRILNQGTKPADNVQLQVDFPEGLTPTDVDGNLRHQVKGQRVVFEPIRSLPPGEEVRLTIGATGRAPGDHRVVANIRSDGRDIAISKEDTTRVYSDR